MCERCPSPPGATRRQALAAVAGALSLAAVPNRRRSRRPDVEAVEPIEVVPGLSVRPRDAWAIDRPPLAGLQPEDVRFLLVHHTASSNDYSIERAPDVIRQTYDFHTGPDKGWPDVCYNFFVDRYGGVWEGRAGSLAGPVMVDATGGNQGFAQLVCLLGDFTAGLPTPEAFDSLRRTLAWLADRHGLDTALGATAEFVSRGSNRWPAGDVVTTPTIAGHRDMSRTACPGDLFYPYVHDRLMADVTALRPAIPPSTSTAETPPPPPETAGEASTPAPVVPVPSSDVSAPGTSDAGTESTVSVTTDDDGRASATSPASSAPTGRTDVMSAAVGKVDASGPGTIALVAGAGAVVAVIAGGAFAVRQQQPEH